jgi:hypothetical protein
MGGYDADDPPWLEHDEYCPIHGKEGGDADGLRSEQALNESTPPDVSRGPKDFFEVAKSIVYPDRTPTPAEVVERLEELSGFPISDWRDMDAGCAVEDAIATIKALEEERDERIREVLHESGEATRYRKALEEIWDRFPHDEWRSNNARELVAIATRALHTEADTKGE